MKLGCCVPYQKEELPTILKKNGYAFVETGFSNLYEATEADIAAFSQNLQENGLQCVSCNGMFPQKIQVVGPNVDYAAIDDYLQTALEKANPLHPEYVVFGSSKARQIPDGFPKADAWDQIVVLLRDHIAPAFRKYQMTCVIEPLRFGECNCVNTVLDGLQLAMRANVPEVQLLVDYYHFAYNHEPLAALDCCKGWIRHVHLASYQQKRHIPFAKDGDDYQPFFEKLREIGYENGNISLEGGLGDDPASSLAAAAAYLLPLIS